MITHAERELRLAGLLDELSDYDGMLGNAVLELIALFAEQGHSGASAFMVAELFAKLASFETIVPLTSNPDEWNDVSEVSGEPMWQSARQPNAFSGDGGKTWYFV